ncbi:MAG: pyruvate kinase, partial [Cetobacterium sp.]
NAILDGTDAIMLSGETAKGKYPIEAVTVMTRIAEKTDPMVAFEFEIESHATITEAVARGTVDVAEALSAKLIVVGTQSGRAARAIRKYFPTSMILAITNNEKTANQLVLTKGVIPCLDKTAKSLEEFYKISEMKAKELGLAAEGDIIVATCGEKVFELGTTNTLKVMEVK